MLRVANSKNAKARAIVAGLLLLFASCSRSRTARARDPLVQRTPIQTNDYKLDLFQGPILASSRITAMGGAYTALAEGADGIPFNPAAASQRFPYSTKNVDFELTAGITIPASVKDTDFDNNGKKGFHYSDFFWVTAGGLLQVGHFGFGAIVSAQNYSLGTDRSGTFDLAVRVFKIDGVVSRGFFHDQLHIGAGVRAAVFAAVDDSDHADEKQLFATTGVGAQGGVLWTPHDLPLRLGATVRSPVIGESEETSDLVKEGKLGTFYLPSGVDLPWEVEWGVAAQLGPRPLNLPWTDERSLVTAEVDRKAARRMLRRKYREIVRETLLLSFSMLVTGEASRAVGVESMLAQTVDRSGERTSVTMRAGAEVEGIPNRLQLRAGSYMEPTRFRESSARLHGTTGFEVRVLDWDVLGLYPEDTSFRVSGAVDVARDYFGWSLGIGTWF